MVLTQMMFSILVVMITQWSEVMVYLDLELLLLRQSITCQNIITFSFPSHYTSEIVGMMNFSNFTSIQIKLRMKTSISETQLTMSVEVDGTINGLPLNFIMHIPLIVPLSYSKQPLIRDRLMKIGDSVT